MEEILRAARSLMKLYVRDLLVAEHHPVRYDTTISRVKLGDLVLARKTGNEVSWIYLDKFQADVSSLSTRQTLDLNSIHYDKIFKLKHEMVSTALEVMKTDERLDKVFPIMKDDCNMLTPDIIKREVDHYVVIEIGTCASEIQKVLMSEYKHKLDKYASVLETRARYIQTPIVFIPIIVGYNSVVTIPGLSRAIINKMCFLYRLGSFIEHSVVPASDLMKKIFDVGEEKRIRNLMKHMSTLTIPDVDETGYSFDKTTYEYYRSYVADIKSAVVPSMRATLLPDIANRTLLDSKKLMTSSLKAHWEEVVKSGNKHSKKAPCQVVLILPNHLKGVNVTRYVNGSTLENLDVPPVIKLWDYILLSSQSCGSQFINEDRSAILKESLTDETVDEHSVAYEDGGVKTIINPNKRKWHRVKVDDIPIQIKEDCALNGLWAKSLQYSQRVCEKVQLSKENFSPDCDVSDIESFILGFEVTHFDVAKLYPNLNIISDLLTYANDLQSNDKAGHIILKQFMETNIFTALLTISLIATELSISIKQNVSTKEFIYKKIRDAEVELIIHPTTSSSHIFYSVRFKGCPIEQGTFKSFHYFRGWWYTEIISTNKSKLANQINAPFTYLNLCIFWYAHYNPGVNPKDIKKYKSNILKSSKHWRMILLSMVQALEDKAVSEEMINSIRYISMQFFKGNNVASPPCLEGPIAKIPTILRSRFTVFLYKRIRMYIQTQMEELPIYDRYTVNTLDREEQNDVWINLLNPITIELESKSATIINVFYSGYTKNKDEDPHMNSDYQMVEKILGQELLEDPQKVEDGIYSQRTPLDTSKPVLSHEWSIDYVADAVRLAEERLIEKLGRNYKDAMAPYIMKEVLKRTHFESLATMKASAMFKNFKTTFTYEKVIEVYGDSVNQESVKEALRQSDFSELLSSLKTTKQVLRHCSMSVDRCPADEAITDHILEANRKQAEATLQQTAPVKSCKCLEAVIEEIKSGFYSSAWSVFQLGDIISDLKKSWGGVCCYLFKKNQHGGLREIYVLTMKSRIVQATIESTFRSLCTQFPEETMTHPENKLELLHNHQEELADISIATSSKVLVRHSSEDAQKWNQNNNVNMYAFIAAKLCHPTISKMVFLGLSLWRGKKILIPDGVMNLMLGDHKITNDGLLNELKRDFFEGTGRIIKEKGSKFLTCNTGMWQGILHFASSFQHLLQTMHYKYMVTTIHQPVMMNMGATAVRVMSTVSSDDSYCRIGVAVPHKMSQKGINQIDHLIVKALAYNLEHCKFFGIRPSPKTTLASPTVGEYNSVFILMNGLYSPEIKSVVASLSIRQTENFMRKAESYSNLLKDIYESGCSHFQTHCHQLVQLYHHYSSIGAFINPLFEDWAISLVACPDPSLGFFILDKAHIAGLMGYNFSLYGSLRNAKIPIIVSHPKLIQAERKKQTVEKAMESLMPAFSKKADIVVVEEEEMVKSVPFAEGIFMSYGCRMKWKRFVNKVSTPAWDQELEKDPRLLYAPSVDKLSEVAIRLSAKASSAGMYEALSPTNSTPEIFASSVYCINQKAFTMKSRDLINLGVVYTKHSLNKITADAAKIATLISEDQSSLLNYKGMSLSLKEILFPNYRFYDQVLESYKLFQDSAMPIQKIEYRRRKNEIHLKHRSISQPIPLLAAVRLIWFGIRTNYGKHLCYQSFNLHKESAYPWLNEDPSQSLKDSPFETHKQMYEFLSSAVQPKGSVRPLMKAFKSRLPVLQILESAQYNYYPGVDLVPSDSVEKSVATNYTALVRAVSCFKSASSMLLAFPCDPQMKTDILKAICRTTVQDVGIDRVSELPSSLLPYFAVLHHFQQPDNQIDTLNILVANKKTTLTIYLLDQYYSTDESGECKMYKKEYESLKLPRKAPRYFGPGVVLMKTFSMTVIVYLYNDQVMAIETKNPHKIKDNWDMFKEKLELSGIYCEQYVISRYMPLWMRTKFFVDSIVPLCSVTPPSYRFRFSDNGKLEYMNTPVVGVLVFFQSDSRDELYVSTLRSYKLDIAFDESKFYIFLESGSKVERTSDRVPLHSFREPRVLSSEDPITAHFPLGAVEIPRNYDSARKVWWRLVLNWVYNQSLDAITTASLMKRLMMDQRELLSGRDVKQDDEGSKKQVIKFFKEFLRSRAIQKGHLTTISTNALDYNEAKVMMENDFVEENYDILEAYLMPEITNGADFLGAMERMCQAQGDIDEPISQQPSSAHPELQKILDQVGGKMIEDSDRIRLRETDVKPSGGLSPIVEPESKVEEPVAEEEEVDYSIMGAVLLDSDSDSDSQSDIDTEEDEDDNGVLDSGKKHDDEEAKEVEEGTPSQSVDKSECEATTSSDQPPPKKINWADEVDEELGPLDDTLTSAQSDLPEEGEPSELSHKPKRPITDYLTTLVKKDYEQFRKKVGSELETDIGIEALDDLIGAWGAEPSDFTEGPLTKQTIRSLFFNHTLLDQYLKTLEYRGVFSVLNKKQSLTLEIRDEVLDIIEFLDLQVDIKDDMPYSYGELDFPSLPLY